LEEEGHSDNLEEESQEHDTSDQNLNMGNNKMVCPLCPEELTDASELEVHRMRTHGEFSN
jgi:hypothetical protein